MKIRSVNRVDCKAKPKSSLKKYEVIVFHLIIWNASETLQEMED